MRTRLIRWVISAGVAGILCVAFESTAFAYPPPQGTAQLVSGCTTLAAGGSCNYVFKFSNAAGTPVSGLAVAFASKGLKSCSVTPPTASTDPSGEATTTLSCQATSKTGTDTVTAKSGKVGASAVVTIGPAAVATGAKVPLAPASAPSTLTAVLVIGLLLIAAASARTLGRKVILRTRRATAK